MYNMSTIVLYRKQILTIFLFSVVLFTYYAWKVNRWLIDIQNILAWIFLFRFTTTSDGRPWYSPADCTYNLLMWHFESVDWVPSMHAFLYVQSITVMLDDQYGSTRVTGVTDQWTLTIVIYLLSIYDIMSWFCLC